MRLFEVDLGSLRSVLAVLQGEAGRNGSNGEVDRTRVQKIIRDLDLPLGGDLAQALTAVKNSIDPTGDVIKDIKPDGSIVINLPTTAAVEPGSDGSTSLDQMASRAAKKAISSKI